jgi:hypothetical protein
MDLKEIKRLDVGWIQVVQIRDPWRALMGTVTNFTVL